MATNAYCKRCSHNYDCHLTRASGGRLSLTRKREITWSQCTAKTKRDRRDCCCPGYVPGGEKMGDKRAICLTCSVVGTVPPLDPCYSRGHKIVLKKEVPR